MSEFLPDSDRDLRLARKIGDLLDEQVPLSASRLGGDPLHTALEQFAQNREVADVRSDVLWSRIVESTRKQPESRVLVHPALWRWGAVAAMILISTALVWILMTRAPAAELVAASTTEMVEYASADGTTITLRPHSKLYRLPADEGTRSYRIEGEAYFDVARREDRTFAVRADEVSVSVLGTRFNVSTWGNKVQVFVADGRVGVLDHRTDQSAELAAGDWVAVSPEGHFLFDRKPAAEALDWTSGALVFRQRPVETIVAELEHHFQINISVPGRLGAETVSGRILLEAPTQSLDDLGLVLGGSFHRRRDGTYIFRSDE